MPGRIESFLLKEISERGTIVATLIDHESSEPGKAAEIASVAERSGARVILIGGSTAVDQLSLDKTVIAVKERVKLPVILFPGNVTGISPNADAILFMSLLNSQDPYFIIGAQALGSLLVYKYNIEAIPTGYLIVGEGGSAGFIGQARGLPLSKPELAVPYALAARYLGMRVLYLEAGSGASRSVPIPTIRAVRGVFDGILVVGGGMRNEDTARRVSRAGADIIVVGTLLEKEKFGGELSKIVRAVSRGPGERVVRDSG